MVVLLVRMKSMGRMQELVHVGGFFKIAEMFLPYAVSYIGFCLTSSWRIAPHMEVNVPSVALRNVDSISVPKLNIPWDFFTLNFHLQHAKILDVLAFMAEFTHTCLEYQFSSQM